MTYLGIDYGSKRIGLARGDDETRVATPIKTVANNKDVYTEICNLIYTSEIDGIVVGLPVSFDGKEHAQAAEARAFGAELQKGATVPMYFQNEMLTSVQAERGGARDVDASAAALMLQSFL